MGPAVRGALAMTFAWGVIAGSVGLNALIKSNQQTTKLKKSVGPIQLDINTKDVFNSGAVLTTVSALIAVVSLLFLLLSFISTKRRTSNHIQGGILAFLATWLLATLIPFTLFFATRAAKVTARLGGITLPQQAIEQAEKSLGVTGVYKEIGYLRLVAILPWFTMLFTFIAAGVLFAAGSRTSSTYASDEHVRGAGKASTVGDESRASHSEAAGTEKDVV